MKTRQRFAAQIVLLVGLILPFTLAAQKLESMSKSDAAWQKALESHELAAAAKLIGQPGSFKGTVSKVYESRDGDIVILDFDSNYRTALTAVLGKAEIALTTPDQIKLVQ